MPGLVNSRSHPALPGGAEAGVDSLMAANHVALVSTLGVMESWRSFARTTALPRFAPQLVVGKRSDDEGGRMKACGSPPGLAY